MQYDFDAIIERRGTDGYKWKQYGDEVIPLWVADMDFVSAEPILQALHRRIDHGVFGYTRPTQELRNVIRERLKSYDQWDVKDEEVLFLPGLVTGINLACHAFSNPGDPVLVQPPVYFHFVRDPVRNGRVLKDPPLVQKGESYEIDFTAFETFLMDRPKVFLFCNPHNPVGRVYTRKELEKIADLCLRHHVTLCSDEIHCDLLYPGYRHIPMATLTPEVARQTVTLMAPSKTFNLAGLHCGFAIIQNPELRRRWESVSLGLIPSVNIMGHVAALAAFQYGQEWLDQVLIYLEKNRDFLAQYVKQKLPDIRMMKMEATYLAWLDCRSAGIPGNPFEFFLREAKVALSDGKEFGKGGEGFVRLNFACPRKTLTEALDRMTSALGKL
ncbi:MAG: PatB family C-S lyase [Desulfobacterales bacterium]|nr:PatB family C-S lyase [Desulfobacterales bacterium]